MRTLTQHEKQILKEIHGLSEPTQKKMAEIIQLYRKFLFSSLVFPATGSLLTLDLQENILSSRLPAPKNEIRKILMGLQYLRK